MALALTGNLPDNGQGLDADILRAEFANITQNANTLISPLTGDVAAGSNKITGLAAGTTAGDAVRYEQLGMNLLATASASSSASITFSSGLTSAYNKYIIDLINVVPSTDGANIFAQLSVAGVFQDGASDYAYARYGGTTATTPSAEFTADDTETAMVMAASIGNSTGEGLCGSVTLWAPAGTSIVKMLRWDVNYIHSIGLYTIISGGGFLRNTAAVDGLRFGMSSGTITSGEFALFGVRKA